MKSSGNPVNGCMEWQRRPEGLCYRDPLSLKQKWHVIPDTDAGAAPLATPPGPQIAKLMRRARGGVLRIQEEGGAEATPWELTHDDEGFLAAEKYYIWERQPAGVTLADELVISRPLRLLLLWERAQGWQEAGELAAACMAGALGCHLAAGRVMVQEAAVTTLAEVATVLSGGSWDLLALVGDSSRASEFPTLAQLAEGVALLPVPPPLVVFHDANLDVSPAAADGARVALRGGVIQALAVTGVVDGPPLLAFWSAFFQELLGDAPGELPRSAAMGRLALAAGRISWQGVLAFSRLAPAATMTREAVTPLPHREAHFFNVGERLRGTNGREIFRYPLWDRVAGAFLGGQRLVGLQGPAGSGKSLMAKLIMERLPRHPAMYMSGRQVVWLNAGSNFGVSALWQQLAGLFVAAGFQADPQWLGQQIHPSPIQVALMFKRLLGDDGWLVVDQCHATQTEEGEWRDLAMGQLVTALLLHTGWRCLITSRQPLALCREDVCDVIQWIAVPPLGLTERAAIIALEDKAFPTPEGVADEPWLLRLVREGDLYPLHFHLALREPPPGEGTGGSWCDRDADGRLSYLLTCLVAEAEPAARLLLLVVAALTFVPTATQLGGIWRVLGEKYGWQPDMYAIHIGQLEALGLVEEAPAGSVWICVAVRECLQTLMAPAIPVDLQRDLALLFYQHGEQMLQEAGSLHPLQEQGAGVDLALTMHQRAVMVTTYALHHSLQQRDPELAAAIFQELLALQGGGACRGLLRYQGLALLTQLEEAAAGGEQRAAIAAGFGVAAKAFLLVKDHEMAQRALQQALALATRGDPLHGSLEQLQEICQERGGGENS